MRVIKDGQVYLNGSLLDQFYLRGSFKGRKLCKRGVENIIPEGQYLCFGDNREHSRDGRGIWSNR